MNPSYAINHCLNVVMEAKQFVLDVLAQGKKLQKMTGEDMMTARNAVDPVISDQFSWGYG